MTLFLGGVDDVDTSHRTNRNPIFRSPSKVPNLNVFEPPCSSGSVNNVFGLEKNLGYDKKKPLCTVSTICTQIK